MGNTYHANVNQKKVTVAIFIPDKINFKANRISRNRDFFHNGKMCNLPGSYSNHKFVGT